MPLIGPSVDRRSLAYVNQVCQSKNVEALMCFTCGQIHTHAACWDRSWQATPRQHAQSSAPSIGKGPPSSSASHRQPATDRYNNARSPIRFHKVKESLFQPLLSKPWETAEQRAHARQTYNKQMLRNVFIARFASEQNGTSAPWEGASELRLDDTEWQRSLHLRGILRGHELPDRTDRVICCPEDCKPCDNCSVSPDSLCGDCEVALCSICGDAFTREACVIPMGLCNDNLWGYSFF